MTSPGTALWMRSSARRARTRTRTAKWACELLRSSSTPTSSADVTSHAERRRSTASRTRWSVWCLVCERANEVDVPSQRRHSARAQDREESERTLICSGTSPVSSSWWLSTPVM